MNKKSKIIHESYVAKELKQKKDLEQKFTELFRKTRGSNEKDADKILGPLRRNRLL